MIDFYMKNQNLQLDVHWFNNLV